MYDELRVSPDGKNQVHDEIAQMPWTPAFAMLSSVFQKSLIHYNI